MTARTESELIEAIRHQKAGNVEFILWRMADAAPEPWVAAIGNKLEGVTIGESLPDGLDGVDCLATGVTSREALERLFAALCGEDE